MKNKIIALDRGEYRELLGKISEIVTGARAKIIRDIDTTQVYAYWFIGKAIIENEQGGRLRAKYGQQVLINLSHDLINRFGKGFSVDNLQNMRRLYVEFPNISKIYETASRKSETKIILGKHETVPRILSWSHYCELLQEKSIVNRLLDTIFKMVVSGGRMFLFRTVRLHRIWVFEL